MRAARLLAALLAAALALPLAAGEKSAPPVQASAVILQDAATGKVLYQRHADQRRPMASTTKVMTALLVIESGRLAETVTVSERAANTTQSSLWLRPGEHMSVEDLLTALLVKSANDAATALAEHLAGTEEAFVVLMNMRARELGAQSTHFCNPHGLYQPDHYTTARDLALITREALKHPLFRRLVATRATTVPFEGKPWRRAVHSKNRLLADFPGGDGVKTGYVKESGQCLVASATRSRWQLVAVLLDSPDLWTEAKGLLEWGFACFQPVVFARPGQLAYRLPVRGARTRTLPVAVKDILQEVIPRAAAARGLAVRCRLDRQWAPFRRGERVGRCTLLAGGRPLRSVPLYAAADLGRSPLAAAWHWGQRVALALLLAALGIRTYAKTAKNARQGRRRRQARCRAPDPGGPGKG